MNQILLTSDFIEGNLSLGPPQIYWAVQDVSDYDASAYSNGPYKEQLRTLAPERAVEFLAGRAAIGKALTKLDPSLSKEPVPKGPTGAPLWPKGLIGSITHQAGVAIAAVAKKKDIPALGIDLQEKIPSERDEKLLHRICDPSELAMLSATRLRQPGIGAWLFSGKEAGYKAISIFDPTHTKTITSLKIAAVILGETPRISLVFTPQKGKVIQLDVTSVEVGGFWLSLALLA